MAFKLSARSLRTMAGVHPDLERFVWRLIEVTPVDFVVLEGLRTVERQRELVASGASTTMNSRHITGHAVDLGAWVGTVRWDMGLYYQIADAAKQVSREIGVPIRWGGAWVRLDLAQESAADMVARYTATRRAQGRKAFIDGPHYELPATRYPA